MKLPRAAPVLHHEYQGNPLRAGSPRPFLALAAWSMLRSLHHQKPSEGPVGGNRGPELSPPLPTEPVGYGLWDIRLMLRPSSGTGRRKGRSHHGLGGSTWRR